MKENNISVMMGLERSFSFFFFLVKKYCFLLGLQKVQIQERQRDFSSNYAGTGDNSN